VGGSPWPRGPTKGRGRKNAGDRGRDKVLEEKRLKQNVERKGLGKPNDGVKGGPSAGERGRVQNMQSRSNTTGGWDHEGREEGLLPVIQKHPAATSGLFANRTQATPKRSTGMAKGRRKLRRQRGSERGTRTETERTNWREIRVGDRNWNSVHRILSKKRKGEKQGEKKDNGKQRKKTTSHKKQGSGERKQNKSAPKNWSKVGVEIKRERKAGRSRNKR